MLTSLHVENIALIRCLDLDLREGFSAFTGETGAGKSILIDAIGLLCGARSEKELIRTGEQSAIVEGLFSVLPDSPAAEKLKEADIVPDEDGSVFIQRKLMADGRSTVKINGRSLPLSRLREAAPALIRIHGQQDTTGLADDETQTDLLDVYAGNGAERTACLDAWRAYRAARKRLEDHRKYAAELEEKKDLLLYQSNELRAARIRAGEEAELNAEHALLANREKIAEHAGAATRSLYRSERSAVSCVQNAANALRRLSDVLPDADSLLDRLDDVKAELVDVAESLEAYADPGNNPGERLKKVEDRLELLASLERKYRTDEAGLADKLRSLEADLEMLENVESDAEDLESELEQASSAYRTAASALSKTRSEAAKTLTDRVSAALKELDMPSVLFRIEILPFEDPLESGNEKGADSVRFLISANAGEEPKPIGKIASGGELSRIMLCLQVALAGAESTPTLIFDEIDTGISGKTNEKIGRMMASVANASGAQVVCVTHAAQLASRAE
ncbi:MAG: DNA repair protein RecN, partial [Clostridia bacterium]|nr:DNA repair protein RecN [Clostridia bacterium]